MKISAYISINITLFISIFVVFETHGAMYKCELEKGRFLYQQSPCNANSKPLVLNNGSSGWSPLRESEKAVLRPSQRTERAPVRSDAGKKTDLALKQCWDRRTKLQAIRAKLRHGYKLKESEALHRQQDNHNDYLKQFCS